MSSHTRTIASIVTLLSCAVVVASAAAAPGAPTKQRVAFVGAFDTNNGGGTWRLIPLTPGPLKADSGTVSGSGEVVGRPLRNGQRVTLDHGRRQPDRKAQVLGISQSVVSTQVAPGLSADIGTWKFHGGIGAYEHVTGGGRFAAVGLASGVIRVSQEGWLTIRWRLEARRSGPLRRP